MTSIEPPSRGDGVLIDLLDALERVLERDELDVVVESDRTPEFVAATDELVAGLAGLLGPAQAAPAPSEDAFEAIVRAVLWDVGSDLVLARSSAAQVPTHDLDVPELERLGFLPTVEIEVDLDASFELATVIVMLERTGEVVTPGLVVEARLTSGRPVRAKLDLADVAVLRDIPVADLGSLVLSFHTERPAP